MFCWKGAKGSRAEHLPFWSYGHNLDVIMLAKILSFYLVHLAHVEVAPTIQLLRHSTTVGDFPRARTTLFVKVRKKAI